LVETFSAVDLPRAIETAIDHTIGLAGTKPIAVVAEYPAHLPAVQGQGHELAQIISSLIAEAISVTNRGEIHVAAELLPAGELPSVRELLDGDPQVLADGGPWAIARVSAIGSGIVEHAATEIITGLNHSKSQPRVSRDGLSLNDSRILIEAYGGSFWIDGLPGEGIRLNFALPLRAAYLATADLSSLRKAVETRLPEDGKHSKTILLMTEEEGLRDLLSQDLAQAGYRVITVPDGANVLAIARTEHPSLILLDLVSRDPPGFDVAMVLKQDYHVRDIPVLFLTSATDPQEGMRMGAVNYVLRAEGTGKLLSAIDTVLASGIKPTARVLVIESSDALRESMILLLQRQGYRVTEARASEEALALAERVNPGLVLVNSKLAQERDYWLLRSLRQVANDMDIFVLAEVISKEEGKTALSRGASGYRQTGKLREILEDMQDRTARHI